MFLFNLFLKILFQNYSLNPSIILILFFIFLRKEKIHVGQSRESTVLYVYTTLIVIFFLKKGYIVTSLQDN